MCFGMADAFMKLSTQGCCPRMHADPSVDSNVQAGRHMWALLFPNNKVAKDKRQDCIKLGVVEVGKRRTIEGSTARARSHLFHSFLIISSSIYRHQ